VLIDLMFIITQAYMSVHCLHLQLRLYTSYVSALRLLLNIRIGLRFKYRKYS
jgi:hypothetical protein